MKEKVAEKLRQIGNSHSKALRQLNGTVDYAREEVIEEALSCLSKGEEVFLMGVKNTSAISRDMIDILHQNGFLFHTLDQIREKGRAVYTELSNPVTGKPMTGSSAMTAIHILRNINQIGIGTDGGGSVLAPALACGLYAIMGKGLGLEGKVHRISTDGISFVPGIGVLAQSYELCKKAIQCLVPLEDKEKASKIKKHPKIGIVFWEEEKEWIESLIPALPKDSVHFFAKKKTGNRKHLLSIYEELMSEVSVLITKEGPVDVYGLGDSIVGSLGETGKKWQEAGGKYFLKIANMADATAIVIPSSELASGYLIMTGKGLEEGLFAIEIADKISRIIERPKLVDQYFYQTNMEKGFL